MFFEEESFGAVRLLSTSPDESFMLAVSEHGECTVWKLKPSLLFFGTFKLFSRDFSDSNLADICWRHSHCSSPMFMSSIEFDKNQIVSLLSVAAKDDDDDGNQKKLPDIAKLSKQTFISTSICDVHDSLVVTTITNAILCLTWSGTVLYFIDCISNIPTAILSDTQHSCLCHLLMEKSCVSINFASNDEHVYEMPNFSHFRPLTSFVNSKMLIYSIISDDGGDKNALFILDEVHASLSSLISWNWKSGSDDASLEECIPMGSYLDGSFILAQWYKDHVNMAKIEAKTLNKDLLCLLTISSLVSICFSPPVPTSIPLVACQNDEADIDWIVVRTGSDCISIISKTSLRLMTIDMPIPPHTNAVTCISQTTGSIIHKDWGSNNLNDGPLIVFASRTAVDVETCRFSFTQLISCDATNYVDCVHTLYKSNVSKLPLSALSAAYFDHEWQCLPGALADRDRLIDAWVMDDGNAMVLLTTDSIEIILFVDNGPYFDGKTLDSSNRQQLRVADLAVQDHKETESQRRKIWDQIVRGEKISEDLILLLVSMNNSELGVIFGLAAVNVTQREPCNILFMDMLKAFTFPIGVNSSKHFNVLPSSSSYPMTWSVIAGDNNLISQIIICRESSDNILSIKCVNIINSLATVNPVPVCCFQVLHSTKRWPQLVIIDGASNLKVLNDDSSLSPISVNVASVQCLPSTLEDNCISCHLLEIDGTVNQSYSRCYMLWLRHGDLGDIILPVTSRARIDRIAIDKDNVMVSFVADDASPTRTCALDVLIVKSLIERSVGTLAAVEVWLDAYLARKLQRIVSCSQSNSLEREFIGLLIRLHYEEGNPTAISRFVSLFASIDPSLRMLCRLVAHACRCLELTQRQMMFPIVVPGPNNDGDDIVATSIASEMSLLDYCIDKGFETEAEILLPLVGSSNSDDSSELDNLLLVHEYVRKVHEICIINGNLVTSLHILAFGQKIEDGLHQLAYDPAIVVVPPTVTPIIEPPPVQAISPHPPVVSPPVQQTQIQVPPSSTSLEMLWSALQMLWWIPSAIMGSSTISQSVKPERASPVHVPIVEVIPVAQNDNDGAQAESKTSDNEQPHPVENHAPRSTEFVCVLDTVIKSCFSCMENNCWMETILTVLLFSDQISNPLSLHSANNIEIETLFHNGTFSSSSLFDHATKCVSLLATIARQKSMTINSSKSETDIQQLCDALDKIDNAIGEVSDRHLDEYQATRALHKRLTRLLKDDVDSNSCLIPMSISKKIMTVSHHCSSVGVKLLAVECLIQFMLANSCRRLNCSISYFTLASILVAIWSIIEIVVKSEERTSSPIEFQLARPLMEALSILDAAGGKEFAEAVAMIVLRIRRV